MSTRVRIAAACLGGRAEFGPPVHRAAGRPRRNTAVLRRRPPGRRHAPAAGAAGAARAPMSTACGRGVGRWRPAPSSGCGFIEAAAAAAALHVFLGGGRVLSRVGGRRGGNCRCTGGRRAGRRAGRGRRRRCVPGRRPRRGLWPGGALVAKSPRQRQGRPDLRRRHGQPPRTGVLGERHVFPPVRLLRLRPRAVLVAAGHFFAW